jgi:hypothetical protein
MLVLAVGCGGGKGADDHHDDNHDDNDHHPFVERRACTCTLERTRRRWARRCHRWWRA